MSLRHVHLPHSIDPQEATEMVTSLKQYLRLAKDQHRPDSERWKCARRSDPATPAAKLLAQLTGERPQVMLDIDESTRSATALPAKSACTFRTLLTMYNIPAVALAGLGGQSIRAHEPADFLRRHQPGREFRTLGDAGAIAKPGDFHLQPTAGHLRRRPHVLRT
jgi:hypothetical protein